MIQPLRKKHLYVWLLLAMLLPLLVLLAYALRPKSEKLLPLPTDQTKQIQNP